ncbi:MAG: hypothetical protein AUJ75_04360 [Candidatus Omnitrophica bacterium CG1_02_49_10]|nr:MAG: hypothetical protein AUJ75_04360 [Candidatus Omnitrophica bacterium CG1_02_49_10]
MFVISNLLAAVAYVIHIIVQVLYFLIIARALISWVSPDPYNPIVQFLHKATEPMLSPIRRIMPVGFSMGVDLSPFIAILALIIIDRAFVASIADLAMRLR